MILSCPSCGTQYVVKDGAIPPEGRQVRCAACKHSWHQDSEESALGSGPAQGGSEPSLEPTSTQLIAEGQAENDERDESLANATLIDPRNGPEAEERAYEEAVIEGGAETPAFDDQSGIEESAGLEEADPQGETRPVPAVATQPPIAEAASDMFSPFAGEGDGEPRRRSPVATILIVVAVVIVLAVLFWFFAPAPLKAKLGLTAAAATPLAVVMSHMDRQELASGGELLTVSGRVINPTAKEQDVPPLQAQLTSKSGKIVYSWTIAPPARSLAAGASASFNSAEIIKAGGDELTITLGQPKA